MSESIFETVSKKADFYTQIQRQLLESKSTINQLQAVVQRAEEIIAAKDQQIEDLKSQPKKETNE